jgi:hypothetical protein
VDDIALDGKVITMTGDTDDTAVFTAGTNGTLSIVTTDTAAAAANIQITADGAAELAGTTVTLDSSGGITLDADGGTISFADDGVSLGAITSSGYSGLAATATALAATGNIAATGHIAWDVDFSGSNVTAAATIQGGVVDNSMLAGSIANAKLVNDSVTVGTTEIDLGTSATTLAGLASVTSTAFVGALTGNATTVTNGVYTTDLGSNVLTFLGTPSSSNLAAAITGETGTGALVFGTSPTFTTSIKTPLIQDTDGDPAITINDGGSVQFEQASISAADLTNTATGSDPNMIISLDLATANFFRVQLGDGEDVTAINFTNPTIGQTFLIRFEQPASGTKATVVWTDVDAPDAENALVYWPGGVAPTLTETNSKSDMIGFVCTGSPSGSTMAFDGFIVGQNMSIPA